MVYVCEEILIEILARLPAKSLIRFMCVCRFWKSIITSPKFGLNFSNRPTKTKLLVHTDEECSALDEDLVVSETADFPFKHWLRNAKVVGSDDGLVCISIRNPNKKEYPCRIRKWNPCIRKHVMIPMNPMSEPTVIYVDGFGATISGSDYKYVRIIAVSEFVSKAVEIYSWKMGTWRRIHLGFDYHFKSIFPDRAPVLRGRLHWMAYDRKESHINYIHCFKLEDEVWEDIMLPECFSSILSFRAVVFVIKESLAMIADEKEPHCVTHSTVWVMQEYGDVNSWSKLCHVDTTAMIDVDWALQHSWIVKDDIRRRPNSMVHLLENGELLLGLEMIIGLKLFHPPKLVKYNPKTRKATEIGGVSSCVLRGFTNYYKESLVFLTDDDHRVLADHEVLSGARPSMRHGRHGVLSGAGAAAGPSMRCVRRKH